MRKKRLTNSISAVINENYTLTLYNIKVCEWMSDETLAMHAEIALNGIPIGYVQNNGCGEGNYPKVTSQFSDEFNDCLKDIKRHHFHSEHPYVCDWDYNIDFLIGMMVEQYYYEKRKNFVWE